MDSAVVQMLTSNQEGMSSIPRQSIWNLWWSVALKEPFLHALQFFPVNYNSTNTPY